MMSKKLDQFIENGQSEEMESHKKSNNIYLALTIIISSLSLDNRFFKERFSKNFLDFIVDDPIERIFSNSYSKIDQERFSKDFKILQQYEKSIKGPIVTDEMLAEINKNLTKEKIFFISYNSENYPKELKKLDQPPAGLFIKGNKSVIKLFLKKEYSKSIAIVGTRSPSSYGHVKAREIADYLSSKEIIIISGLAKGVDFEAHIGALKNGGLTFAVLAGGVNSLYPKDHEVIYEEISENGLIISERMPDMKPNQQDFTFRNRIVAALAKVSLIIEAGVKSGTQSQVKYAKYLKKEIIVLEPKEKTKNNELIYSLIQEGKNTVKEGSDVLKIINES